MMQPTPRRPFSRSLAALCSAFVAGGVSAQSFADLTEARNLLHPYASLLQLEGGAIGTTASNLDDDGASVRPPEGNGFRGLDDDISWDARAYFRDEAFGSRRGTLEAYAGRDGIFAGYTDGKLVGDDTMTRIELRARPWQFYRDGFYRDDELVPNGFYDGKDYQAYLGFGREAQQGLYVEFGPFYERLEFERSRLTGFNPSFVIPADYDAYGGRLYLEQSTVQLDRRRGLPREGFMVTLVGEREWNDSRGVFGTALNATELPSAVWRVRGRLEWYIPGSETATWEVFARGGWHDEKDRVQNFEAQRPLGNQWGEAQLRLRLHLGQSMTLTPFFEAQYSRVLEEDGLSSTKDFFFGGGVESYVHFGEVVSLHAWYSYVDNENRPSIRVDNDVHGEQMFYLGMVLRFGATRR
jgi:hypothetical protein